MKTIAHLTQYLKSDFVISNPCFKLFDHLRHAVWTYLVFLCKVFNVIYNRKYEDGKKREILNLKKVFLQKSIFKLKNGDCNL